jgi:hypothetical protein
MATQGLVTIVHQGNVVMKFVAGCDGMKASKLAKVLREMAAVPDTLKAAHDLALKLGFGCQNCLVVMNERRARCCGSDRLTRLYRKTFVQPKFNPRWEQGTADHVVVINL